MTALRVLALATTMFVFVPSASFAGAGFEAFQQALGGGSSGGGGGGSSGGDGGAHAAPGPIAGAGLLSLGVAGGYLLLRRRRRRR
jgi:hypothetical protein